MVDKLIFEEDRGSINLNQPEKSKMMRFIMSMGITDEKTANLVLLFVALASIVLTVVVYQSFIKQGESEVRYELPEELRIKMEGNINEVL